MLVNQKQLAEILGNTTRHIRRMTDEGMPIHGRKGKETIYNTSEVIAWLRSQAVSSKLGKEIKKKELLASNLSRLQVMLNGILAEHLVPPSKRTSPPENAEAHR